MAKYILPTSKRAYKQGVKEGFEAALAEINKMFESDAFWDKIYNKMLEHYDKDEMFDLLTFDPTGRGGYTQ